MAKSRKIPQPRAKAGGRTGVVIEEQTGQGSQDIDEWFDAAHTPTQTSRSSNDDDDGAGDSAARRIGGRNTAKGATRKSHRRKVKTPREGVEMELPGGGEVDDEEGGGRTKAREYLRKLKRKGESGVRTNFTSPSDLSRVSTAPPTPASRDEKKDDDDDDEVEDALEVAAQEESGDEIEHPLLTQEVEEKGIATQGNDAVQRQVAASSSCDKSENASSPEADFPIGDDENDGDDLAPPALDDDYSDHEDLQEDQLTETRRKGDSSEKSNDRITGLESDHDDGDGLDNNADYDDNDDDKEGSGFNMVHDPETPETLRAERARKEKENIKLKRNKKKTKQKSESESEGGDENDETSKVTAKTTTGKTQKQKKKRSVIFSPKGIPIANRDYETVPIGALVEGSPEEDGPRRSKRAKVKPLEYWRGEKMEFGAHHEEGELAEVFGNMPVVTGIQKALPTPYRKRKQPENNSGVKKKSIKATSTGSKGPPDNEEFDGRKLRRRYKFLDGQEAYLHDEFHDEPLDQSKDRFHVVCPEYGTLAFVARRSNNPLFPLCLDSWFSSMQRLSRTHHS
jgi:hypothetical protein